MSDCDCACRAQGLTWDGSRLGFLFLELTSACNNACPGCSNPYAAQRSPAPLPATTWAAMLESARPHLQWVELTGGEPTLHPEFANLVAALEALALPFTLLTNGRWPDPAALLASLQRAAGFQGMLVSLHGPDAASHEGFSGVSGSFAATVQNIRRATAAGLRVTLSTVLTRYNWNRVEVMVMLARMLGAAGVSFSRYIGSPLPALEATPAQVQAATRRIEVLKAQGEPVGFGAPLPQCVATTEVTACLAGEAFVTVDPWGRVRPCNHAPVHLGDLRQQSLAEILDSSAARSWRAFVPTECTACALSLACHGGCRAEALLRAPASYSLPRLPVRFPAVVTAA